MSKLSCVFLGSPAVAASLLEWLVLENGLAVRAVWTKPERRSGRQQRKNPVREVAARLGLPTYESTQIGAADVELLASLKVDLGLVVAYGALLPKTFFSLPTLGTANLHFSLLPKYRGASPIQAALLNGDDATGVSLQRINNQLDAGDLLAQKPFSLEGLDRLGAMAAALDASKAMLADLFGRAPESLRGGVAQDHSKATYCRKIKKEDGLITGNETTQTLLSKSKAFVGWPGLFGFVQGKKYTFSSVAASEVNGSFPKGTLNKWQRKLFLAARDGLLEVGAVQEAGKKKLAAKDFLNGCRWSFPVALDSASSLQKAKEPRS